MAQMYILSSNDQVMEDWQRGLITIEAPGVMLFLGALSWFGI